MQSTSKTTRNHCHLCHNRRALHLEDLICWTASSEPYPSMRRMNEDAWRCAILPRQPKIMGEGVIRFAELIGWPQERIDITRANLISKMRVPNEQREKILAAGVERLQQPHLPRNALDKATVELRAAHQNTLGGPLSVSLPQPPSSVETRQLLFVCQDRGLSMSRRRSGVPHTDHGH